LTLIAQLLSDQPGSLLDRAFDGGSFMNINGFIAHKRDADGQEQKLCDHLCEVGEIAALFAGKLNLSKAGYLAGLLHDFGKHSKDFQRYIASAAGCIDPDEDDYVDFKAQKGKIDHSTAGAQWIWRKCREWGKAGELVGQIMALCIASHHSGLLDCLKPDGTNAFLKRMEKDDQKTYFTECVKNASSEYLNKIESGINKNFIKGFADQLKRVALNSQGEAHPSLIQCINWGFLTRFLFSCLIDADRINSADFENPKNKRHRLDTKPDWALAVQRAEAFFAEFKGDKPIDKIRRNISDNCKHRAVDATGIYTMTVPTGGGKTYASLRFALHHALQHNLDRVIYIIPYTSIIEQNAEAIRKVIEDESDVWPWVLEHHSNLEPERQTWHSKLVSENWDAPIVLTTMVQFLEVLFAGGTRGARRMHQLANSVLIFDEIQSLPVNCTHLFCNAINFFVDYCKTTAVMCTATQPVLDKLKSPEKGQLRLTKKSELVPDVKKLFDDLKRVELNNGLKSPGWTLDEITDLALSEFQQKGSCLVIVNTKDWARKLYQSLQPSTFQDEIFHLSTNLCPAHRKELLVKIRERLDKGLPVLCISTQLIEAGVDVDFASVIRFLAGLDSIAQAAGRCNRNGLREASVVHVVNPLNENIGRLKDISAGRDVAQRVLSEGFDDMLGHDAITQYFSYYFFKRAEENYLDYRVPKEWLERDDTLLNILSENRFAGGNRNQLTQSFMTAGKVFKAIDSPTQAVIVPHNQQARDLINDLCSVVKAFDSDRYHQLLKKAQQYSVNVFPTVWENLIRQRAVCEIQPGEGIYFLDEQYYSPEFGLSQEPCAPMGFAGV